jgi:2-polyprenyl-6-methoxyphenol hydroxylase-like FAD-dependent oxidoreductase
MEVPYWDIRLGHTPFALRDFPASTPHGSPLVSMPHARMQEALLSLAAEAGAEVRRGAAVRELEPGQPPRLSVEQDGWMSEIRARLVVAADGRNSPTRKWAGFDVEHDPDERLFTGVLLAGVPQPEDTWLGVLNATNGYEVALCNVGQGLVRAYLGHPRDAGLKLAKAQDLPNFVAASVEAGAPAHLYEEARVVGPMASFASADAWVTAPYRDGVALLGDAAANCDPSFGQGMSMTLLGVRLLSEYLSVCDDWEAAGQAYARDQHQAFAKVRTLENWYRDLFLAQGPAADARRARALPLIAADPSRVPDLFGMGPDAASDEQARRRFFGED